jgi:tetratricopeptide (TPR) repeat protein
VNRFERVRVRRPYEKKTASKASALIFGLGLGAILALVALLVGLTMPNFSTHLDNLSYRARSYYRKLIPHPQYLPTPAPVSSAPALPSQDRPSPSEPEQNRAVPPPVSNQAVPAAALQAGDTLLLLPAPSTPIPPAAPAVSLQPWRSSVQLQSIKHQWQTWNNCGPATITMAMSYFGRSEGQAEAAQFLKPNRDDKNVSPEELAAYVQATAPNLAVVVRRGGSLEQLKLFLNNGLPVLAETWQIHDGDGLGHYRLMTGYDDAAGQFNTFDSLDGPNYKVAYGQFEADWRVFNRLYLVVFPPEQANTVRAIIGPAVDDQVMDERILASAQAEAEAEPNDAIAYFNMGDALTRLGRLEEAVSAFDRARTLGLHWRRLWYQFTPFEAYYGAGRYQDVLDLTEATLKGAGGLEEAYYYHGLALQATGQPGADKDFQAALKYNPHFTPAATALSALLEER